MQIKSDLGENLKRNINGKKIWNNRCTYEIKLEMLMHVK